MTEGSAFPIGDLLAGLPADFVDRLGERLAALPELGFRDLSLHHHGEDGLEARLLLDLPDDLALSPFGAASFGVSVTGDGVPARLRVSPAAASLRLEPEVALRIPPELLRPASGTGVVEIAVPLQLDVAWRDGEPLALSALAPEGLSLPPAEIGRSGFVLAIESFQLSLIPEDPLPDVVDAGFEEGFVGLYVERAELRLPPWLAVVLPDALIVERAAFGTLGFSGTASVALSPPAGGALFGLGVEIDSIAVDVRTNRFAGSALAGRLALPFLPGLLGFQAALDLEGRSVTVAIDRHDGFALDVAGASIGADAIEASGRVSETELALTGQLTGNVTAGLGGLAALSAASAEVVLQRADGASRFEVAVGQASFGPLGTLSEARLRVVEAADGTRTVSLRAEMRWDELSARLHPPAELPQPLPDSRVAVTLERRADGAFALRCEAESSALAIPFLDDFPARARPAFRNARLVFEMEFASETELRAATALEGSFDASVEVRLPEMPALLPEGLVSVTTGDPEGWVEARFAVTSGPPPRATLELADPMAIAVRVPGAAPEAPALSLAIRSIVLEVQAGTGGAGSAGGAPARGRIAVEAAFALPALPVPAAVPFADDLARLLAAVELSPPSGTAALVLEVDDARAALALEGTLDDASISLDVLALLAALARGRPAPDILVPSGEVPTGPEVGFGFKALRLQAGSLDPDAPQALVELVLSAHVAGITADGFVRLSDRELAFGLAEMRIPLTMPAPPLRRADLDALRSDPADAASAWTAARFQSVLAALDAEIGALAGAVDAVARQALAALRARQFLLQQVRAVFQKVATAQRRAFQGNAELLVSLMEAASLAVRSDSPVKLRLSEVKVTVPFRDPQNLGVAGSAALVDFAPDDPMRGLEDLTLTLGLSADQIYFSLDSAGTPIPLPLGPRYPGGSASLTKLTLGYGYTRNSFAAAFQGELHLPPRLIADADLSRQLGAGIRLPRHSSLAFRLDVIPVPGPIPVVPAFEFALDLRSPAAPALRSADPCRPFWDGLQLVVPGVIQADVKHVALSPFFGPIPCVNVRFDGDLQLGDETNGVTVIVDNLLWLAGVGFPPTSVPYLASPTEPFFDNLCVHLRMAGFGVNFDLQRPFPSFDPLAVLEVLGLLADPMMPIDPDGALANTIRVALTEASVVVPADIRRLFPEMDELSRKELNVVLNLGTVITAIQAVVRGLDAVRRRLDAAGADVNAALRELGRRPPDFSPAAVLGMLPPELRKIRAAGALGGFEARAVLLLLSPDDAPAEFARRGGAAPPATGALPALGRPGDPAARARFRPRLPSPGGAREHYPDAPGQSLFEGIEFAGFTAADLEHVPRPRAAGSGRRPRAGIVVGAHVKVFEAQRYRFLGFLFDDGSFGFASEARLRPLRLRVAGIELQLPLTFEGRLALHGRARRDGVRASLEAEGRGTWTVIPHVAELEIAPRGSKPARLALRSDGRFALRGDVRARLFDGLTVVNGSVDVSETHCFVAGDLRYRIPDIVDARIAARGRLGPGRTFELTGDGTLDVFGRRLAGVHARITQDEARFSGELHSEQWRIGTQTIPCTVDVALAGAVALNSAAPRFSLEGEGTVTVFDAGIQGRCAVFANDDAAGLRAEGALLWQGRRWLAGRVELTDKRVAISGRTSFAVDLTPGHIDFLGAEIDLAHLFLRLELEAAVDFSATRGILQYSVAGDWLLAARLPGAQVFPLAAAHFGGGGAVDLAIELVHISDIALVPFQGVQIPIPRITGTGTPVRFGRVGTDPAASWNDKKVVLAGGVFPVVSDGSLSNAQTQAKVFLSFDVDFDDSSSRHALTLPLSGEFTLSLVWHEGRLALRAVSGGTTRHVHLQDLL